MKILFITPAPLAGSQQYTHQLANALVGLGNELAVATAIDFEMKPYPRQYRAWEVFDGFKPHPFRLFRFLASLREWKPDIVHFVGAQQPSAYLVFSHLLRIVSDAQFVFTPQDVFPNISRSIDKWSLPRLYSHMRHVFLNAEQNRGQIMQFFGVDPGITTVLPIPDHLAFIRDSIEPKSPDIAQERRVLLCFGLIEPRKGIPTLLDALPLVLDKVPEAYAVIAGKPLMDIAVLEQKIRQLRIESSVTLIPRYLSFEEMAGQFTRAECLVLPYDSGWNSGVLASAFGYGKPVVATDVGGFAEVIKEGETGLLVPPKNPKALADALAWILTDSKLSSHISASVRQISEQESWERLAVSCSERYRVVLDTQ